MSSASIDPAIIPTQLRLLAELTAPVQWVVLGAGVLGTAIVLFKPKFARRRDPLERSPQQTSLAQQRSVDRQMQGLLVELSEMSRQVTATLDTRAAKLDQLIREADEKIATLTALQSTTLRDTAVPIETTLSLEADRRGSAILGRTLAISTSDESSPGQLLDRSLSASSVASEASPYESDPRHAQVYLLADQGQSASEIAAQLQRPSGEIQLILALRPH